MNALSVPRAGSGYGKRAFSASPFQMMQRMRSTGGFSRGGAPGPPPDTRPWRLQFSANQSLKFGVFVDVFFYAIWTDNGSLLSPIWTHVSMFLSIKKSVDFSIHFWTPFGRIMGPSTLQNGALASTRRSFSKNHLFRPGANFCLILESKMCSKVVKKTVE